MQIVFISNFINHHQVHVADELYRVLNGNYWFIETERMPDSFINSGYPDYSTRPYVIKSYTSSSVLNDAINLAYSADVVVIGSAPEYFVSKRIHDNKLTFRYSERWFKSKPWYLTGPRGWINIYKNHIRHRNKPVYMLCASAFTAKDVNTLGAYLNKCYKWGYFTKVDELDINTIRNNTLTPSDTVRIMWCSRFLRWKHPELPVELAARLKDKGYNFVIDMFGSGDDSPRIKELSKNLKVEKYINFKGNLPNDMILNEMRRHHIFLFTSDRNEGWGAVLNEAMSCDCAVICSDEIGSVPFLIQDGVNGLIFRSRNLDSLEDKVVELLESPEKQSELSRNARRTMSEVWNPENAARQLINLVSAIKNNDEQQIPKYGPCSKA